MVVAQNTNPAHCRLHYEEKPGLGPCLVFLHGRCLSSRMWEKQLTAPELKGYRMILPDLPGHGLSERSSQPDAAYTIEATRDQVLALLAQKGIDQYVLVGHSYGGNIALEMLPLARGCVGIRYTLLHEMMETRDAAAGPWLRRGCHPGQSHQEAA